MISLRVHSQFSIIHLSILFLDPFYLVMFHIKLPNDSLICPKSYSKWQCVVLRIRKYGNQKDICSVFNKSVSWINFKIIKNKVRNVPPLTKFIIMEPSGIWNTDIKIKFTKSYITIHNVWLIFLADFFFKLAILLFLSKHILYDQNILYHIKIN